MKKMIANYDGRKFNCDVLICGGGVSGCSAAIVAARRGLRVMLLEKEISLGGLATNDYVIGIAGQVEGMSRELMERAVDGGFGTWRPHCPIFDPEKTKILLEEMITEHHGRILYGAYAIDAKVEDNMIKSVVVMTKSGITEISAKIYVDATGDGDIAAAAGAPFEVGSPEFMGLNMGSTLAFRMAGVNFKKYQEACAEWTRKELEETGAGARKYGLYQVLEEEAVKNGDLPYFVFPSALMYQIPATDPENAEISVMTCHSYYNHNTDVEDLTRQIVEQHQQMKFLETFYRKYLPGFENCRLTGMGSIPGIRDSRRIIGDYVFKAEDIACGTKFEDGIARFPEFFDTHHPTSAYHGFKRHIHLQEPHGSAVTLHNSQKENLEVHRFGIPAGIECRPSPRDYCEIPFRALIPRDVNNLLLAGRCVSAEFDSCGAVRVIAPAMSTGQACAVAADLCIKENILPKNICPKKIRQLMIEEENIPLNEPTDGYWEMLRNAEGEFVTDFTDTALIRTPDGKVYR